MASGFMEFDNERQQWKVYGASEASHKMPAGLYNMYEDCNNATVFKVQAARTEKVYKFNTGPMGGILEEVKAFWGAAPKYARLGITHKRIMLLHGPAGCGKTGIIAELINEHIKADQLAIIVEPHNIGDVVPCITTLRRVEPERRLLVVLEDFDSTCNSHEDAVLEMLDGTTGAGGNLLFVCTTNFLSNIPTRIRCRPSRVDTLIFVGKPNEAHRKDYLDYVLNEFGEGGGSINTAHLAAKTEGYSLAMLKELLILLVVLEVSEKEALEKLEPLKETEKETSD